MIASTSISARPKVVVESLAWENGPSGKSARTRWTRLGYESQFRRVEATEVGGAIAQSRLLVARVLQKFSH